MSRLLHAGRLYGVLSVSVPGAYAQDAEEQALFGELARDIAMALHQIAADQRLRASHEMLARAAGRSAEITQQLLAFARKQTIAPRVLDRPSGAGPAETNPPRHEE